MEARRHLPDWPRHRDALQVRWPKLTDGDLLAIDGELDYLVEALQLRYGIARAEAQAQSDAFVAELRASAAANDGDAAATVVASNCVVSDAESYLITPSVAMPNRRVPVAVTPVAAVGMHDTKNVAGVVVLPATAPEVNE